MMKIITCSLIACMIVIPIYVYGYATNIAFLDCACKWDKKEIVVWIENSQESKNKDYVVEAFNAWHTHFPELQYSIYADKPAKWDIYVKIVDKYLDEENPGILAKTDIRADWGGASIEKVFITIPTHITVFRESEQIQFNKMNEIMFYNIILHETGHAIGLGHANENEERLIDPMFKYIDSDERMRTVSKLDIMTLERLYR